MSESEVLFACTRYKIHVPAESKVARGFFRGCYSESNTLICKSDMSESIKWMLTLKYFIQEVCHSLF